MLSESFKPLGACVVMPKAEQILSLVRRAAMYCRATPGRVGGVVNLSTDLVEDLLVVGDLHGNIPAFGQVLQAARLRDHPKRHLVIQELVHGNFEYPHEGGDKSHQLVDLVAALKCEFPDRVHWILGNHELSEITGRVIAKHGHELNRQFQIGIETAYGDLAETIADAYRELFCSLPIALRTPNRVWLSHTIPEGRTLDELDLSIIQRTGPWPSDAMKRGGVLYELTWGRDCSAETTDRFAALVDVDLFVTGHQACEEGFRVANPRLLIIDGSGQCPAYCCLPANEPLTIDSIAATVQLIGAT